MQSSSAETVRVICRFRPHREQLLRGGNGQGTGNDAPVAAKKEGNKRISAGPERPTSKEILGAGGSHNPATGYKLEYAPDGKSLAFTPPIAAGGVKGRPYQFTFDTVFDPTATQADAFNAIAKETVFDVLKGYNGTIFAYGQTGSGKTHSMFGAGSNPKMRGVIPRSADELFAGIADSEELDEVTIKCSFLEIYLESIRDLLQPKNKGLKIREMPSGEVYVQGLSDEYVSSSEDIMALLAMGEKNRTVASTDMNEVSSRSHSVLIIVVNQKLKDGSVRVGKLNLADLAGSERVERTNATGVTLEQAKQINASLSALGNCINALTDSKRTHIPFRDSVLTFLLKDSLGGNTKTTLLVCASPEESDCLETLSTLNFAKRAKKIKNSVSVNLKLGVAELTLMVNELKKELGIAHKTITALQKTILTMQAGGTIPKEMLDSLLKPVKEGGGGGGTAPSGREAALSIDASALMLAADAHSKDEPTTPPVLDTPVESAQTTPAASAPPLSTLSETAPSVPSSVDNSLNLDTTQDQAGLMDTSSLMGQPLLQEEQGVLDTSLLGQAPGISDAGAGGVLHGLDRLPSLGDSLPMSLPTLPGSEASTPRAAAGSIDGPVLPPEDAAGSEQSSTRGSPMMMGAGAGMGVQAAAVEEREEKIAQAMEEIEKLKLQIEQQAAEARQKESAWEQERQTLRTARPIASSPTARAPSAPAVPVATRSQADVDRIAALVSKNERLEKQMSEMKETWTAYLDLILENQKAQERERRDAIEQEERQQEHQKNAKVVKPVRKQGFFSFFSKSSKESEQKEGETSSSNAATASSSSSSSSAPSSAAKSSPPFQPQSSSNHNRQPSGSSAPAGSTASPAVPIKTAARTSTAGNQQASASNAATTPNANASRGTFDQAIRIGYLQKKPVGFSITRQWRKRLFVLRPESLDYYEVNLQPNDGGSNASASSVGSVTNTSSLSSTPDSTAGTSVVIASPLPSSYESPSNLKQHFRGSITLDSQTTVTPVSYGDMPFGLEVTTKDKHSKLCADTEKQRDEWVRDILAVVQCKKEGKDPAMLIPRPASLSTTAQPLDSPQFQLDPELLNHANFLLTNALAKLPDSSPTSVNPGEGSLQNSLVEGVSSQCEQLRWVPR